MLRYGLEFSEAYVKSLGFERVPDDLQKRFLEAAKRFHDEAIPIFLELEERAPIPYTSHGAEERQQKGKP